MIAVPAAAAPIRTSPNQRGRGNLHLALWVLIYGTLFHWSFVTFTAQHFAYAQFTYEDPTFGRLLLTYLAALLPLVSYDRRCEKPAHYLMSVLYLVLYVPGTLGLAFMWRGSGMDLTVIQLSLLFSVMALFGVARLRTARLPVSRSGLPSTAFDVIVVFLTIVNIVAITYTVGTNFELVAFSDVYEQRFRNTPLVQSTALGYLFSWQTTFFSPYLIAVGLAKKRRVLVVVALLGSIAMYGAFADKGAVLVPAVILILRRAKLRSFLKAALAAGSAAIFTATSITAVAGGLFSIKSLLLVRTLAVPGFTMSRYFDFFNANGYTYWSHLRLLDGLFTTYQYGASSLGQVIGIALGQSEQSNWNANFWASDGLAAAGPAGILILLPFLCLLLVSINFLGQGMDTKFFATVLTGFMFSMTNVPITTSLLSGGFIWIIAMRFSQPLLSK